MLAWLILLIAALSGLLAVFQNHADRLQSIPGLPVAICILGVLSLLYVLSFSKIPEEPSSGRARVGKALALLAAVAATIPVLRSANVWPWTPASPDTTETRSAPPVNAANAAVRIRRSADGLFIAQGEINGAPVQLIVDSGAASVTLRSSDAEAAGVDVQNLTFDTAIQTANGAAYVAPIRLRTVTVGGIQLHDVEAFVAKPGSLNESLLGMSFLRRLTSYSVSGDFMTLRQ
ncbi:MAG: TIGR02281 family clan AA aspartic protease [Hyphomicrobium sp.]